MLPIVVEIALLILVVALLIWTLIKDVIARGYRVWERDAVGHLAQTAVCLVCFLATLLRCRRYVLEYELLTLAGQRHRIASQPMWHVFYPLVVLTGLIALKMIFFRVKPFALYSVILVGLITIPIFMESYFDHHLNHYPLWMTALPFSVIMVAVAFNQCYSVFRGSDLATRIFYGYSSKLKRAITLVNFVSIVCVSISFICSLYFLETSFTNHEQGKYALLCVTL